jgi:hypothetical protein
MKKLSMVLLAGTAAFFIGCGSGSSDSTTVSTTSDTFSSTSSAPAEPTISNAKEVGEAVVANDPTTSAITVNPVGLNSVTQNKLNPTQVSLMLLSNFKTQDFPLNDSVPITEQCPNGGSVTISGPGYIREGDVFLDYDNCKIIDTTINGKIEMISTNCDGFCGCNNVDIKYITDLTIQSSTLPTVTIKNGSETDMAYAYDEDTCIANSVGITETAFYSVDDQNFGVEGLNIIMLTDYHTYTTSWYYRSGKIYIDNLTKYVTVDPSYDMRQTPFVSSNLHGLTSGQAVFDMSDGAKTIIKADDGTITVELDTNGDGQIDESTTLEE